VIDRPDITLVATVYFPPGEPGQVREQGFRESLASWALNLDYGGRLHLAVVNDGPALPNWREWTGSQYALGHERSGAGGSLNLGIRDALTRSPLVANIDDDWLLAQPFDLTPWAQMLLEDEAIGAVHLLAPYPGCSGTIEPRKHGWVVRMNRHNLVAGIRACLYHKRYFDAYGYYPENCSAWESERIYNERFCQMQGPESVLALPLPWKEGKGAVIQLGQVSPCTSL
jgi:hypothetical protein